MDRDASPVVTLRDAVVLVNDFPLLSGVDLDVEPASLTVVTGANGAGKTSLLTLLGGPRAPDPGLGRGGRGGPRLGRPARAAPARRLARPRGLLLRRPQRAREPRLRRARAGPPGVDDRAGAGARGPGAPRRLSRAAPQRRPAPAPGPRLAAACAGPPSGCSTSPTPRSTTRGGRSSTTLIGDVVAAGATVVVSAHDPLRCGEPGAAHGDPRRRARRGVLVIRTALLVAGKDLRVEARSRVLLWQVVPFGVMALLLSGLALGPGARRPLRRRAGALLPRGASWSRCS